MVNETRVVCLGALDLWCQLNSLENSGHWIIAFDMEWQEHIVGVHLRIEMFCSLSLSFIA